MKYHPDRNRNKSDAEQEDASKKFKDITEAYSVLSDKDKKKKYDCGQMDFDGDTGAQYYNMNEEMGGMGGMPGTTTFTFSGNPGSSGNVDPNEIFKMFFGGGMSGMSGMSGMGGMGGMGGRGSKMRGGGMNF